MVKKSPSIQKQSARSTYITCRSFTKLCNAQRVRGRLLTWVDPSLHPWPLLPSTMRMFPFFGAMSSKSYSYHMTCRLSSNTVPVNTTLFALFICIDTFDTSRLPQALRYVWYLFLRVCTPHGCTAQSLPSHWFTYLLIESTPIKFLSYKNTLWL
jgi:hypothetical protein